jgi:hypothetical protein
MADELRAADDYFTGWPVPRPELSRAVAGPAEYFEIDGSIRQIDREAGAGAGMSQADVAVSRQDGLGAWLHRLVRHSASASTSRA